MDLAQSYVRLCKNQKLRPRPYLFQTMEENETWSVTVRGVPNFSNTKQGVRRRNMKKSLFKTMMMEMYKNPHLYVRNKEDNLDSRTLQIRFCLGLAVEDEHLMNVDISGEALITLLKLSQTEDLRFQISGCIRMGYRLRTPEENVSQVFNFNTFYEKIVSDGENVKCEFENISLPTRLLRNGDQEYDISFSFNICEGNIGV